MSGLNFFSYTSQILYHFCFVFHSFRLCFCFVFYLIIEFQLEIYGILTSRTQYFHPFTVWLASIFSFEYIHPRFTMSSLAIGLNFHTFYPRQPQRTFSASKNIFNCFLLLGNDPGPLVLKYDLLTIRPLMYVRLSYPNIYT